MPQLPHHRYPRRHHHRYPRRHRHLRHDSRASRDLFLLKSIIKKASQHQNHFERFLGHLWRIGNIGQFNITMVFEDDDDAVVVDDDDDDDDDDDCDDDDDDDDEGDHFNLINIIKLQINE